MRQNAPRIVEDFKEVIPQQRLAAREENVVNAIRQALVQDSFPPVRGKFRLRECRIFVPHTIAVRTAEIALRRQFQRHMVGIAHDRLFPI